MSTQNVRERNLDAYGFIRVREHGVPRVFPGPSPTPFHYQANPNPREIIFEAEKGRVQLAITSLTIALQDSDPHYVELVFVDDKDVETVLTEPLVQQGTLHLAYPHPLVLPLWPSKKWLVAIVDEAPSGALINATIIGYTFTAESPRIRVSPTKGVSGT